MNISKSMKELIQTVMFFHKKDPLIQTKKRAFTIGTKITQVLILDSIKYYYYKTNSLFHR